MKIYTRYVGGEIGMAILLVLGGFLSLFAFFDMIGEVKNVGNASYGLQHAFLFVLLRVPGRLYELMPIAVLIGTLFALSSLARSSEIAVLRTSGLSTGGLFLVIAKTALVFALFTLLVGEVIAPSSERLAQQVRLKQKGETVTQYLRSGIWVKDGHSFINIQSVLPDMRLRTIRIYDIDDNSNLVALTEAQEGRYVPPASWQLTDVNQIQLSGDKSTLVKNPTMEWKSAINPDILSVLMVQPERMSLVHLITYIQHLKENGQKTERYSIAFWKKIIYPLTLLVMAALALPFAYTHNRVGGVSLKIFSGVMLGIFFHMVNGLFSNLGAINNWSPLLSALAPPAIFLLIAVSTIGWFERR